MFGRLGEFLRGGTRRLRPYEQAILAAFGERLAGPERDILDRQVAARPFLRRSNDDRMVLFVFDRGRQDRIPLFENRDEEHCLARARLRSGSSRNVVQLMIHRGRLSSLEFRRTLQHLDAAALEVEHVTLEVEEGSTARAIDPLEHGATH